jgi:hypothetical protein
LRIEDNVSSALPRADVHSSRPIGRVGDDIARSIAPIYGFTPVRSLARAEPGRNTNAKLKITPNTDWRDRRFVARVRRVRRASCVVAARASKETCAKGMRCDTSRE